MNYEYQRGQDWKPPQWKRLVDSVLRGYTIPSSIFTTSSDKLKASLKRASR